MELSTRRLKLIKNVSGSLFNEGGFNSDCCPGMTSPVPRWFCDLRSEGRIKVNCMSYATIYLRNDGNLFHLSGVGIWPEPLRNAINSEEDCEKFLDNVYKGQKPGNRGPGSWDLWECCEYIPDQDCEDRSNLWKVAAAARRTGRFMYTALRKTAKEFLEGYEKCIPWVYAPNFDQFTVEYEQRYREKLNRIAAERQEWEKYSRKHRKRIEFNLEDLAGISPAVDHCKVLGVLRSAGPREIKSAYWSLAKQFHPDLNPGDQEAERRFKELSISYKELMCQY